MKALVVLFGKKINSLTIIGKAGGFVGKKG